MIVMEISSVRWQLIGKSESSQRFGAFTFDKVSSGIRMKGEEYAEVTAHDFVAGLQHAADFSVTNALFSPIGY